jgi:hypothetical protein
MEGLAFSARHSAAAHAFKAARSPVLRLLPPRSTARTAASGAAYRGSNPWGATNQALFRNPPLLPELLRTDVNSVFAVKLNVDLFHQPREKSLSASRRAAFKKAKSSKSMQGSRTAALKDECLRSGIEALALPKWQTTCWHSCGLPLLHRDA